MLRKVRFGNFQFRLEIGSDPVPLAEKIQNLQSGRIGKRLADTGLAFKHLGLDAVARRSVSNGHSSILPGGALSPLWIEENWPS